MTTRRVEWQFAGNLQRLESRFDRGCYIFTYRKPHSEVVYVGTASSRDGFMARWAQHLGGFRRGARTVWRPVGRSLKDIMSASPDDYSDLSREGLIWIPGTEQEGVFSPHFPSPWTYEAWWENWIYPNYLWDVEVFVCPLESDHEAKILESQLQERISTNKNVSYYTPGGAQSWLGKPSIPDLTERWSLNFEFDPIPREDSEGQQLLVGFESH